ncbi:uncharacterized protein FPOAC1_013899 [Fusarium poae]|uniref:uncharacterized protein n=1 Tax=Fusarium poae TaxID=36050 RepID=UPI001D036F7F|nr:uncharacterized protein FPOAC1_013899 [Fusarium poae]KAG8664192.1 hypothetical protein FPOAC1_013899 [Fusarium poae]
MDLSEPSGYESYSNRLDPHDEVDNAHVEKAARLSSDEQALLKQRRAPPKSKGGALDSIRLALRVLILLERRWLGENSMALYQDAVNVAHAGYGHFAPVVQIVALVTRLSFFRSMRDGAVHNVAVFVSSGLVIAGWIAASVYLIVDKEVLKNNHWDLWSWSCQNNSRQSYIPWASLCTEMTFTYAASLGVMLLEIVTLVLFVASLRGMNILGKYNRASSN